MAEKSGSNLNFQLGGGGGGGGFSSLFSTVIHLSYRIVSYAMRCVQMYTRRLLCVYSHPTKLKRPVLGYVHDFISRSLYPLPP
jgi:hypothetical protein